MNQTKPERQCALYGRVSTDRQARIEDGGLDTQFSLMERRVQYESDSDSKVEWAIFDRYREEGRSGKNLDRPEFRRMMQDIQSGLVNTVIVHKIDRITRSLRDCYDLLERFEQHGVQFISLNEKFDTTTAAGRMMLKMLLVFAELEREQTGERTLATLKHRARQGLKNGNRNFGYDSTAEGGKKGILRINEEQATIVRERMFQKLIELGSAGAVTRHLQEIGVRVPEYQSRRGKTQGGGCFSKDRVIRLLRNPVYIGKIKYKNEIFDGQHQGIVTEELFNQVQRLLGRNKITRKNEQTPSKHTYLLQGLLRCGQCAAMMTPTAGQGRGRKTYHYYQCTRRAHSSGSSCKAKGLPAKAVEDLVLDELGRIAITDDEIEEIVEKANGGNAKRLDQLRSDQQSTRNQIVAVKGKIKPLITAIEEGTPFRSIQQRLGALEGEMTLLDDNLTKLEFEKDKLEQRSMSAQVMVENYRMLPQILEKAQAVGDWQGIKQLVRCYVEVIEYHRDPGDDKQGRLDMMLFEQPYRRLVGGGEDQRFAECWNWLPEEDSNL